jgi:signal transduction histidine kinase
MNLVDNALRYSPRNAVVTITLRPEARAIRVSVEDDGPGVPPPFVPRLFEKFSHAGRGTTGLGLYFCRITIERWGGQIGYEPREKTGARFWFRLPVANGASGHG